MKTHFLMRAERTGVPMVSEDFSMTRNVSVTPVQSLSAGERFSEKFRRGEMISRRMRMIDGTGHQEHTSQVIEPSNRVAITRANTPTSSMEKNIAL